MTLPFDESPSSKPNPFSENERILGDFRLLREIGRGGMGVVYEAEQISLGRRVAVKVLESHVTLQTDAVVRFQREATAAANLSHSNILPIHSIGEEAGHHFFSMDLVDGWSLETMLDIARETQSVWLGRHRKQVIRPLEDTEQDPVLREFLAQPVSRICSIMAATAAALQHGHDKSILHRDVKPANILVRSDGEPLLIDFGLARNLELPSLTQSGQVVGSPHSLAPEQIDARTLDYRVDVYGLGVTLYELLTLQKPFDGNNVQEVFEAIQKGEPAPPRKLAPALAQDLEVICLKAIHRDRRLRYSTAAEFGEDLNRFLAHEPILARPDPFSRRIRRWCRRHPWWSTAAAVLLMLSLVTGTWWWRRPAFLELTTDPNGAKVWLDEKPVLQATPGLIRTRPGEHQLRLALPGFEEHHRTLTLDRGHSALPINLASVTGILRIDSDPRGAEVTVRDRGSAVVVLRGRTPFVESCAAGQYEVTLQASGFPEVVRGCLVSGRGQQTEFHHQWPTAALDLKSAELGAEVTLLQQNRPGSQTQVSLPLKDTLLLSPGLYTLRSRCPNYDEYHRTGVQLKAGSKQTLTIGHPPIPEVRNQDLQAPIEHAIAGDLHGDGLPEFVVLCADEMIRVRRADGKELWRIKAPPQTQTMRLADLTGDGARELVIGGQNRITVVSSDGRPWQTWKVPGRVDFLRDLDLDKNGVFEVWAATDSGEVAHISEDGMRLLDLPGMGGLLSISSVLGAEGDSALAILTNDHRLRWIALAGGTDHGFELPDKDRFTSDVRLLPQQLMEGEFLCFVQRARGTLVWCNARGEKQRTFELDEEITSALELEPADDGPRLLFGTSSGRVVGFDGLGNLSFSRELSLPIQLLKAARFEFDRWSILATTEQRVIALHGDGRTRFELNIGSLRDAFGVDTDANGRHELWLATRDGRLLCHQVAEELWWSRSLSGLGRVAVGEFESAPGEEVLAQLGSDEFAVLDGNGVTRHRFRAPVEHEQWLVSKSRAGAPGQLWLGGSRGLWQTSLLPPFEFSLRFRLPVTAMALSAASPAGGPAVISTANGVLQAQTFAGESLFELGRAGRSEFTHVVTANLVGDAKEETIVATARSELLGFGANGPPSFRHALREFPIDELLRVRGDTHDLVLVISDNKVFQIRGERKPALVAEFEAPVGVCQATNDGVWLTVEQWLVHCGNNGEERDRWPLPAVPAALTAVELASGRSGVAIACESEIIIVAADGEVVDRRWYPQRVTQLVPGDVDGDGEHELVLVLDQSQLVATEIEDRNPRRQNQQLFQQAVAYLETGQIREAIECFRPARFGWLTLDARRLPEFLARLLVLEQRPARIWCQILERSPVVPASVWGEAIVRIGRQQGLQAALAQARQVLSNTSDFATAQRLLELALDHASGQESQGAKEIFRFAAGMVAGDVDSLAGFAEAFLRRERPESWNAILLSRVAAVADQSPVLSQVAEKLSSVPAAE